MEGNAGWIQGQARERKSTKGVLKPAAAPRPGRGYVEKRAQLCEGGTARGCASRARQRTVKETPEPATKTPQME
jgi:hypothetical protein